MTKKNVEIHTNLGVIGIELDVEQAPVSVENFLRYVKEGFYEGTVFHRVIKGFMIQGGGMAADMKQKNVHTPIQNEADNGLKNLKYTIAMARTSAPHTATSQFFINTSDNAFLNFKDKMPSGWGYAVFGKATSGMDVVDRIEKVKTSRKGFHDDVPLEAVMIEKIIEV